MIENSNFETRSVLDIEWARMKNLIPEVIKDYKNADDIEKDVLSLIDGQSTCLDILKSQKSSLNDSVIFMLLRLEKDGVIGCKDPMVKLRDIHYKKNEVEKDLELVVCEKNKLLYKISNTKEELNARKSDNDKLRAKILSIKEKTLLIKDNITQLEEKQVKTIESVGLILDSKVDMLIEEKEIKSDIALIKEESKYLNDEKWAAMESIKTLEKKIDGVVERKESLSPKMSTYRGVVRDVYKILRDVKSSTELALKADQEARSDMLNSI